MGRGHDAVYKLIKQGQLRVFRTGRRPADEDLQNTRATTIAQLRALEAECLAMAAEARATLALLDNIKLP
jgi:hypothetical protein